MPETCTCGAQLPPDALFCHKCGKPQRDIAPPEPEVVQPTFQQADSVEGSFQSAPQPAPAEPPPPTFRNPIAVRIALLVGIAGSFLGWIPLLNWLAAGFFAVFFYRRKTKAPLTVNAGMRLGWITGVVMFTLWCVEFALLKAFGNFQELLEKQLQGLPANDPYVQQVLAFLESPSGLVTVVMMFFVMITCFSVAGGALGAKLGGGNRG
jgi:hypothetical protein